MRMYHYSKSKNETTVTVNNEINKYAHNPPPPPFLGVVPCQLPAKLKAEPWPLSPPCSDYLLCNSYQAVLSLLTNASTSINGERGLEDRCALLCSQGAAERQLCTVCAEGGSACKGGLYRNSCLPVTGEEVFWWRGLDNHERQNEKETFIEGVSLKEMQIIFYLTFGQPYWGKCEWEKTNGFLWPRISCKI